MQIFCICFELFSAKGSNSSNGILALYIPKDIFIIHFYRTEILQKNMPLIITIKIYNFQWGLRNIVG
jgi:hypothetical protein